MNRLGYIGAVDLVMVGVVLVVVLQMEQIGDQHIRSNVEALEEAALPQQRVGDRGQRMLLGQIMDFENVDSPFVDLKVKQSLY